MSLLNKAAKVLDLPADVASGLPYISITANREMLIERHQGIVSYDDNELCAACGDCVCRIKGDRLVLSAMTATELRVKGRILSIEFVY